MATGALTRPQGASHSPQAVMVRPYTAEWQASIVAALRSLLADPLSEMDKARTAKAVRAAYLSDGEAARSAYKEIEDGNAKALVDWYLLRTDKGSVPPGEIETYRLAHPDWPSQKKLRRMGERALFLKRAGETELDTFFKGSEPLSGAGLAALAQGALDAGKFARAARFLSRAWRDFELDDEVEAEILARMGMLLSLKDHRARADFILMRDAKSLLASAIRVIEFFKEDDRKAFEARVAMVRGEGQAGQLYATLPRGAQNEAGMVFNRIQWLRRQGKNEDAWALLSAAPHGARRQDHARSWWIERRINCRQALILGTPEQAYKIAGDHGLISGADYIEAEFLSGWIALLYLGDTETALRHFLALRAAAVHPHQIARAQYWLSKTAIAAGKQDEAKNYLHKASEHRFAFYGQLAAHELDLDLGTLDWRAPTLPSLDDIGRFSRRGAVKAMVAAQQAGLDKIVPLFALHLADMLTSEGELVLLAELVRALDRPGLAVRIGGIALAKGFSFEHFAYPSDALPVFEPLTGDVEQALLLAVVRQESEFNADAVSGAGAKGLMQLMPATAREVAGKYQLPFEDDFLLSSPGFNLKLGSAYLSGLLQRYSGSYVLTLAAYNAGPGRVDTWMQRFGDPRQAGIDPVDWIEKIPFSETRDYVQKILAATQTFRFVLAKGKAQIALMRDIGRGRDTQFRGGRL